MNDNRDVMDTARFKVGYALKAEKVSSVIQPSLILHSKQRGIDLIEVDLSKPLVDQGPFHCVVHKLYTPDWNRQLLEFRSMHPDAVLIDNPSCVERLHNRESMLEAVTALPQTCIKTPRQVVVYDHLIGDSSSTLSDLKFPVIAKPLLANGSDGSHEMSLVFSASALSKVTVLPVALQEFVDHDGVLFKVYVAGDHVKCVKRTSLPNISEYNNTTEGGVDILPFSRVSSSEALVQRQPQHEPTLELINELAKGLRNATKLHLFNFDMIRDARAAAGGQNMYYIIDINYFPGYAKVPGFEHMLTDFFWDIVSHNHPDTPPKEDVIVDATQEGCPATANHRDSLLVNPVILT